MRGAQSYAGGPGYPTPMPQSSTLAMPHTPLMTLTHVNTKISYS